jgi:hypothetical protein
MANFKMKGNDLYDNHSHKVAIVKGDDIYDDHSHKIAIIKGSDIYDDHSHKIATMNDVKRDIQDGLGGATLAALWLCFVR